MTTNTDSYLTDAPVVIENVSFTDKMHSFIVEIVPFLSTSQRLDVRANALEALLSQDDVLVGVSDEDLLLIIKGVSSCLDVHDLIQDALTLMINISCENLQVFTNLRIDDILVNCLASVKNDTFSSLVMMFLANISSLVPKAADIILFKDLVKNIYELINTNTEMILTQI